MARLQGTNDFSNGCKSNSPISSHLSKTVLLYKGHAAQRVSLIPWRSTGVERAVGLGRPSEMGSTGKVESLISTHRPLRESV